MYRCSIGKVNLREDENCGTEPRGRESADDGVPERGGGKDDRVSAGGARQLRAGGGAGGVEALILASQSNSAGFAA